MKPNLYKKEISLLLGILVAGIILVLFILSGGLPASHEVSDSGSFLQAPSAIKLIVEKASFLLSDIFTI